MSAPEIGAGRRARLVKTGDRPGQYGGNQGHPAPQLVIWEQGVRLGGLVLRGLRPSQSQEWINKDRGPRNRVVTGDCRTEVISLLAWLLLFALYVQTVAGHCVLAIRNTLPRCYLPSLISEIEGSAFWVFHQLSQRGQTTAF